MTGDGRVQVFRGEPPSDSYLDPSMTPYPMPEEVPPPTVRKRYYDPLVSSSVIVLFTMTILMPFASMLISVEPGLEPIDLMLIISLSSLALVLLVIGTVLLSMRNDIHWTLPTSGWLLLVCMLITLPILDYSRFFWLAIPFTMAASVILYTHWYRDQKRISGRL